MSAPFSIYDELLGDRPAVPPPGATSLIKRLLEVTANEAVSAEVNVLTGYSLVKTARKKGDKIDAAILSINDNCDDEDAWVTFETYVKDIHDLEKFLLDLDSLPGSVSLALEVDDVNICTTNIQVWEQNRTRLHTHLQTLRSSDPASSQADWEQQRDDAALLHQMISNLTPELLASANPLLTEALEQLKVVLAKVDDAVPPPTTSIIHGIKAAWLMGAALAEKAKPATDAQRKYHLGTDEVWNVAKSFTGMIVEDKAQKDLADAYNAFVKKLIVSNSTPPVKRYIQLIVASSDVTRPFMFRNKVLVEYCRALVTLYNADTGKRVTNLGNVTTAINKSLEAAKAAASAKARPDPQTLGVDADFLGTTVTAFADAKRQVEFSLKEYAPSKATEMDEKMKKAVAQDEERLRMLQNRCGGKPLIGDTSSEVSVTITRGADTQTVNIRGNTKIGALVWSEKENDSSSTYVGAQLAGTTDQINLGTMVAQLAKGGALALELTTAK